jgi:hypothetical protein
MNQQKVGSSTCIFRNCGFSYVLVISWRALNSFCQPGIVVILFKKVSANFSANVNLLKCAIFDVISGGLLNKWLLDV